MNALLRDLVTALRSAQGWAGALALAALLLAATTLA